MLGNGSALLRGLVLGTDGNLYGTTEYDDSGYGMVFKLAPDEHSRRANPYARTIQASDGNFYGTTAGNSSYHTYGTVYKLTAEGQLTTPYQFDLAHLIPACRGERWKLLRVTRAGGNLKLGVVLRISPRANLHVLYEMIPAHGLGLAVVHVMLVGGVLLARPRASMTAQSTMILLNRARYLTFSHE